MTMTIDKTGKRYGKLQVISTDRTKKRLAWLCICDCGEKVVVDSSALGVGNSKSCGKCNRKDRSKNNGKNFLRHGETNTSLHKCWMSVVRRINHDKHYLKILLTEEWTDYEVFAKWAKLNGWVDGLTIDRIDNNKGYCPENCRFVTRAEQARNRTTTKLNWAMVEEIRLMAKKPQISQHAIAVKYNVSDSAIHDIIKNKRWAV